MQTKKTIRQKLLASILTLAMVLGMMPMMTMEVEASGTSVTTWDTLQAAMAAGGNIVLGDNITADADDTRLEVPSDKTVTLDLAGYTIDRNLDTAVSSGSVIFVRGNLTIKDTGSGGTITGGNTTSFGGGIYVNSSGTLKMEGGTISGNFSGNSGGGVYNSGTFTMDGGTITGNTNTFTDGISYGGGVYSSGTFTMNGGAITNNKAPYGGGIGIREGTNQINGGTITGNTTTKHIGNGASAGIYIDSDYVLNVQGNVTITGNTDVEDNPSNVRGKITLTGALDSNSRIGTHCFGEAVISSSVTAKDYISYFTYDQDGYFIGTKDGSDSIWTASKSNPGDVTPPTYTVTFNANGGEFTGGATTSDVTVADDMEIPTPTKTDYVFGGWYDNDTFTGDALTNEQIKALIESKTLYAKWEFEAPKNVSATPFSRAVMLTWDTVPNAAKYQITTYEGNSVVSPPKTAETTEYTVQGLNPGTTYTIEIRGSNDDGTELGAVTKIEVKTRELSSSEKARELIMAGTYTLAQSKASTADEAKAEIARQINALTGVSETGINTVVADDITIAQFNGATAGEADDINGTNGSVHFSVIVSKSVAGQSGHESANILNLQATITATAYVELTFNANGGKFADNSTTSVVNIATGVEIPIPTWEDYDVEGWYTDTTFADEVTLDEMKALSSDTTVYAKWQVSEDDTRPVNKVGDFIVTGGVLGTDYELNGKYLKITTAIEITIENFDKDTSTAYYIGADTNDDSAANITLAGVNIDSLSNLITLRSPINLTLAKDSVNTLKGIPVFHYVGDNSLKLDGTGELRVFVNQLGSISGGIFIIADTLEYAVSDTAMPDDSATYTRGAGTAVTFADTDHYVRIKAGIPTVTFDPNNGTAIGSPVEIAADMAIPTPTWDYSFDGWYKDDGTKVTDPTTLTESTTLYAKWTNTAGKIVRTTPIEIDANTATTDKLEAEGWKWDKGTKTLTLDGLTMDVFDIPEDASALSVAITNATINVILADGSSNSVTSSDRGISGAHTTTFKGKGSLTTDTEGIGIGGIMIIIDGGTYDLTSSYQTISLNTLTVNDGTLNVETTGQQSAIHTGGQVIINGGEVTATAPLGKAAIFGSVDTSEGTPTIKAGADKDNATDTTYTNQSYVNIKFTPPAPTVSSIAVKTPPTKTLYGVGDDFDPSGMVLEATMSDGTKQDITTGFTHTALDSTAVGADKEITVTYNSKTTTLYVNVNPTYNVTFDYNGATINGETSEYVEFVAQFAMMPEQQVVYTEIFYKTITRDGYTFKGWGYTADATEIITGQNADGCVSGMTVYAVWEAPTTPSSGGSSSTNEPDVDVDKDTGEVTAKPDVSTQTDDDGTTTAKPKQSSLEKAINEASEEKKDLEADGEDSTADVILEVKTNSKTKAVGTELIVENVEDMVEKDIDNLVVTSDLGTVTLDQKALETIAEGKESNETVILIIRIVEDTTIELTEEQKAIVGNEQVYELYIEVNGNRVSDFDGGTATVQVPDGLAEDVSEIRVYYVDDEGNIEYKPTTYDKENGTITFVTDHFSHYLISTKNLDVTLPFIDVDADDWFYDAVQFVYQNELMNGTSDTTFAPTLGTTRAMMAQSIWNMESNPTINSTSSYNDVSDNKWYSDAIAWTSENGIYKGFDDGTFRPNDDITREQLVAILYRYADFKGMDMTTGENTNILSYDDASEVGNYATSAMQWAIAEGIVLGKSENTLDPKGTATRAEVATILLRFIEID